MDYVKILSFIGTEFIIPLTIIMSIYLGYFKAKFKGYGDIDAKLQKLPKLTEIESALSSAKVQAELLVKHEHQELISEIEKTIAKSKNSSEFEYWKRKADIEKVEAFAFKISEASREAKDVCDNSFNLMIKIYDDLFDGDSNLDIPSLTVKHGSLIDSSRAYEMYKADILFKIYFEDYSCEKFNEAYRSWLVEIISFNEKNMGYSQSIIKNLINIKDAKEASLEVSKVLVKRNNELVPSRAVFDDATRKVLENMGVLVNAVRLNNQ